MPKPPKIAELLPAYKTGKVEKERLNIYLPKPLVEELRKRIPARERTQFISDVLAWELYRIRVQEALRVSAGAWSDESHPELATGEDIDRWIAEGRKTLHRDWSKEWGRDE